MRHPNRAAFVVVIALGLALAACGTSSGRVTAVSATTVARWTPAWRVPRVLDLSTPRRDRAIIVATAGRPALLRPGERCAPLPAEKAGTRARAARSPTSRCPRDGEF